MDMLVIVLCLPSGYESQFFGYCVSEIFISKTIFLILFNFGKWLIFSLDFIINLNVVRRTPLFEEMLYLVLLFIT